MTPERLAELHALSFECSPRPWRAEEFAEILNAPGVYLLEEPGAFLIARSTGSACELLTLAVHPDERRQGRASRLLARLDELACRCGLDEVFLEVAETNTAARALYANTGFAAVGLRKDYYADRGRKKIAALVLRKRLD